MKTLIINGKIVNEGKIIEGSVWIRDGKIESVVSPGEPTDKLRMANVQVVDAKGLYILPGLIDDQVHFREPGLIHKAEILTESKAAVAGGLTSFMEMPNTVPNTLTQELLEQKYERAAAVSVANYSFFMGASNDNLKEVLKTDGKTVCGIKVFMGSSTGNMLVDNQKTLEGLFSECSLLIATHCEDEATIRRNLEKMKERYGESVPVSAHPLIRDEEACYRSSSMAVELAAKFNTRLHILHISTAKEISLFSSGRPIEEKKITAEACIHHLWFTDKDYIPKGNFIKWNPAVKSELNRAGVWKGILDGNIDIIATDHAPHTLEEKQQSYLKAPAGGPLVQHSLVALLEFYHQGKISLEKIAEKTAHNVARCFQIKERGFIRPGYAADLVLVDLNSPWEVKKENILYKCGWSPFEGTTFRSKIVQTYVNGNLVYDNSSKKDLGIVHSENKGQRLIFNR